MTFHSPFFLFFLLSIFLFSCSSSSSKLSPSSGCPTPDRPYLHLENPSCFAQIPPPTLTDIIVDPPGGKVPLTVRFRSRISITIPELKDKVRIVWDLDGVTGPEFTLPPEEEVSFLYTECKTIIIRGTPVVRFGENEKKGVTRERQLTLRCNQPPVIRSFFATGPFGPPNGPVGTSIHFSFDAVDPDNDNPDLAPFSGIRSYLLDLEGDGVFDVEIPSLLKDLGYNHTYLRAGTYLPVLRVIDGDGAFTDSVDLQPFIQILANVIGRGSFSLSDPLVAFYPLSLQKSFLLLTENGRLGFVTDTSFSFHFKSKGVGSFPRGKDLVVLQNWAVVLDQNNGFYFYPLTTPSGKESPPEITCPSLLPFFSPENWESLNLLSDPKKNLLKGKTSSGNRILLWDIDPFLTSPTDPCTTFGTPISIPLDLTKIPGGFNPSTGDRFGETALLYPYLFLLYEASTGETKGIVTFDLSSTDPQNGIPVCNLSPESCPLSSQIGGSPSTLFAIPPTSQILTLLPRWGSLSGTSYTIPLTAYGTPSLPSTLYVDGAPYSPGSDWWWESSTTIGVTPPFFNTLTSASAVTLFTLSPSLLLVPLALPPTTPTRLKIFEVFFNPYPSFQTLSTTDLPFSTNLLLSTKNRLFFGDAGGVVERRGVYFSPLTDPGKVVSLLPQPNSLKTPSYPGPSRFRTAEEFLWVQHGNLWVDLYPIPDLLLYGSSLSIPSVPEKTLYLIPSGKKILWEPSANTGVVAGGREGLILFSTEGDSLSWKGVYSFGGYEVFGGDLLPPTAERSVGILGISPEKVGVFFPPSTSVTVLPNFPGEIWIRGIWKKTITLPGREGLIALYSQTPTTGVLRFWQFSSTLLDPSPSPFLLPYSLPSFTNTLTPNFAFGETDRLSTLPYPHRLLWFDNRLIVCIDPLWGRSCPPGEEWLTLGPVGIPIPFSFAGNLYLIFLDFLSGPISVYDPNGNPVTLRPFHPCREVPVQDQTECARNFSFRDGQVIPPYFLLTTPGGIFVIDLFTPSSPRLVTWIRDPKAISAGGVLLSNYLRIFYLTQDGTIQIVDVAGLFQ